MREISILLAEDNPGDQNLFELALTDSVDTKLDIVSDGAQALRFLRKEGPYADAPRPDLVIVDMNLPQKSGPEILVEMNGDPALRDIPVAMFTGAEPTQRLADAFEVSASFYIVKPDSVEEYFTIVQALQKYCRNVAESPEQSKQHAEEFRRHLAH